MSKLKKPPEKIRCIGLIANAEKPLCRPVVQEAARLVQAQRRVVLADHATGQMAKLELPDCPNPMALAHKSDLLLVFGGDGTMLRVAREVAGAKTPILGINVGGLGFLTAVSSRRLPGALKQIWDGDFSIECRPLISASGNSQGCPINQVALNDFVIGRGGASRMVELEVSVDGHVLTCYSCDGLIISSPTGSTAYSLSAGGAVVCPAAEVFTLTPICPHTLSNRSVIVSFNSSVQVKVISRKVETMLTADGQVQSPLAASDVINIYRSDRAVRLLHLGGSSFFETLRQKLNWSGSHI